MTISWSALRDARTAKGWTQKELAEHLTPPVHPKTVVNWESEGNSVSSKAEYRVRRALGRYLDYAHYLEGLGEGEPALPPETWLRHEAGRHALPSSDATAADAEARRADRAIEDARRLRLSEFATLDLLGEVQRRVRANGSIASAPVEDAGFEATADVPGPADDEHAAEDWDVSEAPSKEELALAAKKAARHREQ